MKKLLLFGAVLAMSLQSAKAQYPLSEDFDGVTTSGSPATGALPSGWTTGVNSQFHVYGLENLQPHGWSAPNACSVEMSATHTADTLITPTINPITANTKLSISYRFVDKLNYPTTGTTLGAGDHVSIDAYLANSWSNGIATIDMSTNPTPMNSYTTYTYNCTNCGVLVGLGMTSIKIRMDVARANGDWYLDVDNFIVADNITGIQYNAFNTPSIAVSPNPCSNNFWLWVKNYQGNPAVNVKIYNNMGQLVKNVTTTDAQFVNQYNIDVKDLARGIYTVEVNVKNEVSKTKIVLE
jgi:hypothetical protein